MKNAISLTPLIAFVFCLLSCCCRASAQVNHFNGKMSRQDLEGYLSRSMVTDFDQLNRGKKEYYDLINLAAKTNARCMHNCYGLGYASELPINKGYFDSVRNTVQDVTLAYTRLGLEPPLVGVAIWEKVTHDVDSIWMSDEVANTFHVQKRRFIFDSIKYAGDKATRATPDISRPETQMYFYYLATRYIDCGIETLHMGIIGDEDHNDAGHVNTWALLCKIRDYAANHNRGLVLINADTYGVRLKNTDTLLYDYCIVPTRVSGYYSGTDSTWSSMWNYHESEFGGPGQLTNTDCSPYGKMLGGLSPLGWYADAMPYQVWLDNTLTSNCNCLAYATCYTVYGFDEISWFALQTEDYRNKWLCYASAQVNRLDKNCYFVMPARKIFTRHWTYYSAMNGYGFNQADAIYNAWTDKQNDCDPNNNVNLKELWGDGEDVGVVVYPNPVKDVANIVYTAPAGKVVTIKIVDIIGKTVAQFTNGNNRGNCTWNTAGVPAGIYFCTASAAKGKVGNFRITILR